MLFNVVAAETPVTRVVNLIKGLKTRIEEDAKTEEKGYNKYACWCTNMSEKKSKAIAQAMEDIASLHTKLMVLKQKVATNKRKIKTFEGEIRQAQKDIQDANDMFSKQDEEFKKDHAELSETLNGLHRALKVLRTNLLQNSPEKRKMLVQIASAVSQHENLDARSSEIVGKYLALVDSDSRYTPQSGTIQGILSEMYKTFTDNYQQASEDWLKSAENTAKLVREKNEQIAKTTELLTAEKEALGKHEVEFAQTEEEYSAASAQLNHDNEFFQTLEKNCRAKKEQYDDRVAKRHREKEGIEKALEILAENRAHFLKSFQKAESQGAAVAPATSFLQMSSTRVANVRTVLRQWAARARSPRLALLAAELKKSNVFAKILEKIDGMIVTLKEEEKDDRKQFDKCKEDEHTKNMALDDKHHKTKVHKENVEALQKEQKQLMREVEENIAKIEENQMKLAEMKTVRDEAHVAYKAQQADDEKSIELLNQVHTVLMEYYQEEPAAAFFQEPEFKISEETAPVAEFTPADSNSTENKGIVSLIENLIGGLQQKVRDDNKEEEDDLVEFLEMKKITEEENAALGKENNRLNDRLDANAQEQIDHNDAIDELSVEIKNVDDNWAGLEEDCKWIYGSLEKRKEMRVAETAGLNQARDILQGAKLAFLQK